MRTKEELKLIREYCEAFRDWARLIHAKAKDSNNSDWDAQNWAKISEALSIVELAIRKSCYLDRRIYVGEKERLIKCPKHQGRWSGCVWGESMCEHGCQAGSNVTGWLTELHEYLTPPPDTERVFYTQTRCFRCGGTREAVVHNPEKYAELMKEINNGANER